MKVPWPGKLVSVGQTRMIVLEKLVEPQSWYLDFMGKWESFEGFYDKEMLWLDLKALGLAVEIRLEEGKSGFWEADVITQVVMVSWIKTA